jgi:transcriptional regulator with XRE-family HTH domain
MRRAGQEHRLARVGAGLSLRHVAKATGASHQQLMRFERGELSRVSFEELGSWFAVVGLDLAIRAYPGGDPIRDYAQLALLERFRARLHTSIRWRSEVPLPMDRDLRAWDADIRGTTPRPWRCRIDAETRVADAQALERRLTLKARDDPEGHVILLLAGTRANRRAVALLREGLRELLPLDARSILRAVTHGQDPGGSGIVML